jgi:hypothetical protein
MVFDSRWYVQYGGSDLALRSGTWVGMGRLGAFNTESVTMPAKNPNKNRIQRPSLSGRKRAGRRVDRQALLRHSVAADRTAAKAGWLATRHESDQFSSQRDALATVARNIP